MIVRLLKGRDGVARVYTVEGYRDEQGRARQRTIASHGRLDVLLADDPDALDRLRADARQATDAKKAGRGQVGYDTAAPSDGRVVLNLGWLLVDAVLERLGAAAVVRALGRARGWEADTADALRLVVCSRVVWPSSKLAAWERRHQLWAGPDVALGRVYRCLDRIAETAVELQQAASASLGRTAEDLASVDYDVTNYFFHIDAADPVGEGDRKTAPRGTASRQRGCSKEHRTDPIIQMGLFLDAWGLPVCYRLFDGNIPDVSTLPEALSDFKQATGAGRVVVVADKAMHTAPNLGGLHQAGDGWIVSASARHADKHVKTWLADPAGWVWNDERTAKVKSAHTTRQVLVSMFGVDRLPVDVPEKTVAIWSADAAERDRHIRADLLDAAEALAGDEAAYRASNRRGAKKYIRPVHIDTATGVVLAEHDTQLAVDFARAEDEARWDGYQMVRTSETHLPDQQILDRYRQLWRIEQTFRVSKTGIESRPVYVRTPEHIEAHFATCFLALTAERLLERWTGLPSATLLEALKELQAIPVGDGLYRISRPPTWDHIDHAIGVNLDQSWATIEQLRHWRRELAKTAKTACVTTLQTPPKPAKTRSHTTNTTP